MRVTFLSTYDTLGGAAQSAFRTAQGLRSVGVEVNLLVKEQHSQADFVQPWRWGKLADYYAKALEAAERFQYIPREADRDYRFQFSIGNYGLPVQRHPLVQQADVLHVHWINRSFLGIRQLRELARLGKPLAFQFHDMWTFTGGCHYAGACTGFHRECGACPLIKGEREQDLSRSIWRSKQRAFRQMPFTVTTSSNWLAQAARSSSLLQGRDIRTLPTPVDTQLFAPGDRAAAKQALTLDPHKTALLFVSMNLADRRKGFHLMEQALQQLHAQRPELADSIQLVVMGRVDEQELLERLPYPIRPLGRLSNPAAIAQAYTAADYFLMPSQQDNLPNTILEALACGAPSITFATGGIPEMVDHQQSGYVAQPADVSDFAQGVRWALTHPQPEQLRQAARQKALRDYTFSHIGQLYRDYYQELLS